MQTSGHEILLNGAFQTAQVYAGQLEVADAELARLSSQFAAASTLNSTPPRNTGYDALWPSALESRMCSGQVGRSLILYDVMQARRGWLARLHDMSSTLSDKDYFSSAAFLYALHPDFLPHAEHFRQQVGELVSKLQLGERIVVWDKVQATEAGGFWGGRIEAVRRPTPTRNGDIDIEVAFQSLTTTQPAHTVRWNIGALLDTQDTRHQLHSGWFVRQGQIAALARRLYLLSSMEVDSRDTSLFENLAHVAIAADEADVDLFVTAAFPFADQEEFVAALVDTIARSESSKRTALALQALHALGGVYSFHGRGHRTAALR